jgi:serine/threonine protein kinase
MNPYKRVFAFLTAERALKRLAKTQPDDAARDLADKKVYLALELKEQTLSPELRAAEWKLFASEVAEWLQPATKLNGRALGEGSYCSVYRNVLPDGTIRAEKVHRQETETYGIEAHTWREMRALRALRECPGVCVIQAWTMNADTRTITQVMTLYRSILTELDYTPKFITRDRVLRWSHQLLDTLEFMHGAGVVHRDIKPDNIALDKNDNLILLDFGMAVPTTASTTTGHSIGRRGAYVCNARFRPPDISLLHCKHEGYMLPAGYPIASIDVWCAGMVLLYVMYPPLTNSKLPLIVPTVTNYGSLVHTFSILGTPLPDTFPLLHNKLPCFPRFTEHTGMKTLASDHPDLYAAITGLMRPQPGQRLTPAAAKALLKSV